MPILLDGGCNEVEDPTNLPPNVLVEATGCEYRVGRQSIHIAKGRQSLGAASGTVRGVYHAGFDGELEALIVQVGDTYEHSLIQSSMTFTTDGTIGSGTLPLTGVHYANRHYVVNGVSNHVYENISGVTHRSMGMVKPTQTIGLSVTQGSGSMTASTGLIYWLTEYDSTRGIESVYATTSSSSGAFSSKTSVVLTISGTSTNFIADKYRIYRTTDGGEFPDGSLLATIASSSTSYTDTNTSTSSAVEPMYGSVAIGGLDFDRDTEPPLLTAIGGPFEDSLVGFPTSNLRVIQFTPAGRPESWPSVYQIPLNTARQDVGVAFGMVNGLLIAFTRDSIHAITRLPREIDSAFAGGEVTFLVTDERGCISRRGVAYFTIAGTASLLAFVARDGVFATDGTPGSVIALTDVVNWSSRIDTDHLDDSVLINDPLRRQLVFLYRKPSQSNNTGVMYLDYQRQQIRVTHPDHGQIVDAALAPYGGVLRLISADARSSSGKVYVEGTANTDDGASIAAAVRTVEIFPGGRFDAIAMVKAMWMHDITTANVHQEFFFDRSPFPTNMPVDFTVRQATNVGLFREVNSMSLRLSGSFSDAPGIHWLDLEPVEKRPLGGQEGA